MTGLLREVFTLVVGEFGGKVLRDFFRGELREGAGVLVERVKSLIKENPRADLLYTLLTLPESDAASLWARYKGVKGTAKENDFVVTVASALPHKADNTVDMERAKEVFSKLASMTETEFADAIEMLKHDPIAQHIRVFVQRGKGFAEALLVGMSYAAGIIDRQAAEVLPDIRQRIQAERARIAANVAKLRGGRRR